MGAELAGAFDEMWEGDGVRPPYRAVHDWLSKASREQLELRRREAELLFRRTGITFAVCSEGGDPERLIPFDVVPRVLSAQGRGSCATRSRA